MPIATATRSPAVKISASRRVNNKTFGPEIFDGALYEVEIQHSLESEAATFRMTFLPRLLSNHLGTVADVLKPMDYIEIQFEQGEFSNPSAALAARSNPAVLLRGFVDTVAIQASIIDGKPRRSVIVEGRDYSKIALIETLYDYADGTAPALAIIEKFASLHAESAGEHIAASQISSSVVTTKNPFPSVVSPVEMISKIKALLFDAHLAEIGKTAWGAFPPFKPGTVDLNTDNVDTFTRNNLKCWNPIINAMSYQPETNIWSVFAQYANNPWMELFFDDDNNGSHLIYRTTPWIGPDGNLVVPDSGGQAAAQPVGSIDGDLTSWSFSLSDVDVCNLLVTQPEMVEPLVLARLTLNQLGGASGTGIPGAVGDNPTLIGGMDDAPDETTPSSFRVYGLRPRGMKSPYFNINRATATDEQQISIDQIGTELNRRLVLAFGHTALLWTGTVTIKGRVGIHIGDYITLKYPFNVVMRFYVSAVTQMMRLGTGLHDGSYTTTLVLKRGQPLVGNIDQPVQVL